MKLIVRIVYIISFFACILTIGSCSKDDSSNLSETERNLIGTWVSSENWYGQKPVMKLSSGGTLTYTNNFGESYSGTWSYNANNNILTRTSGQWSSTRVDYVQSVSNTTLVLLDFDGDASTWHK